MKADDGKWRPASAEVAEDVVGETTEPKAEAVAAGAAIYTPLFLRAYDWIVLRGIVPLVWGCPLRELRALYARHLGRRHLDAGVGTGYFIDRVVREDSELELTILDLNPNCLATAARRLARFSPALAQGSVLEPFPVGDRRFDSVACSALLHCLPGDLRQKSVVFDHARAVLVPGGVLFGCTLLGKGIDPNPLQRRLLARFNRRGTFCNLGDDGETLQRELADRFDDAQVEQIGMLALFTARAPA